MERADIGVHGDRAREDSRNSDAGSHSAIDEAAPESPAGADDGDLHDASLFSIGTIERRSGDAGGLCSGDPSVDAALMLLLEGGKAEGSFGRQVSRQGDLDTAECPADHIGKLHRSMLTCLEGLSLRTK